MLNSDWLRLCIDIEWKKSATSCHKHVYIVNHEYIRANQSCLQPCYLIILLLSRNQQEVNYDASVIYLEPDNIIKLKQTEQLIVYFYVEIRTGYDVRKYSREQEKIIFPK